MNQRGPAAINGHRIMQLEDLGNERGLRGIVVFLPLPRSDCLEDASLSPPVMSWEIGLFGRGSEGQEISLSDQRGPLFDYVLRLSISPPRAECGRSWGLHFNYSPHCVLRRAGFFRGTRTCETFPRFAIDILHCNSASESPCFDVLVIGRVDQCAAVIQSVTRAAS